jgi:hypothetical protein
LRRILHALVFEEPRGGTGGCDPERIDGNYLLSTSHIVQVAANMAQAASTAFPPLLKIMAPAVAARGLPVTAIQCFPCSGGFCVVTGKVLKDWPNSVMTARHSVIKMAILFIRDEVVVAICSCKDLCDPGRTNVYLFELTFSRIL